ncbi:MAG: hypothetical protein AAF802_11385 [Planctomycetota bacterium]
MIGTFRTISAGKMFKKHYGTEAGIVSISTRGDFWEFRIDFDPNKGPHFNAMFRAAGEHKSKAENAAFFFPWPGHVDPERWMRRIIERIGDVSQSLECSRTRQLLMAVREPMGYRLGFSDNRGYRRAAQR